MLDQGAVIGLDVTRQYMYCRNPSKPIPFLIKSRRIIDSIWNYFYIKKYNLKIP